MTARLIDGKALSGAVRETLMARIKAAGKTVRLDAVLVGGDRAAGIYAENQAKTCAAVGIDYRLHRLPDGAGYDDIAGRILLLNTEDDVRAIMLHLPLPSGVDHERIQALIAPEKDVEGVNPANIGNVVYGRRSLVPCTALASVEMIESTGVELRGARWPVHDVVLEHLEDRDAVHLGGGRVDKMVELLLLEKPDQEGDGVLAQARLHEHVELGSVGLERLLERLEDEAGVARDGRALQDAKDGRHKRGLAHGLHARLARRHDLQRAHSTRA